MSHETQPNFQAGNSTVLAFIFDVLHIESNCVVNSIESNAVTVGLLQLDISMVVDWVMLSMS